MRILQIITSLRAGGAEKLIVDMVPGYKKRGLDVDVLLFDGTDTPFKQQLEQQGVNVYCLGYGWVFNPILILRLIPYLRRYDIVHTHNTAPQLFAAIGSLLCSVVLCTTEHNTTNRRRNLWWYAPIDKWMYSRYAKVISISEATTEALRNYINIKTPVITIPNGIDIKKYTEANPLNRKAIGISDNAFLLMMVAGFRYQKDQDTIIRAITLLPDCIQLCLVGDGVRRKHCEELAIGLGVQDRIAFTGMRTDIPNVLKMADVVVMSSHFEGFGLAAVEGMAAGKPVIASDVPGLKDIVQGYGLLFPSGNVEILSTHILKLMEDKAHYGKIAKQCQERAWDFDIQKMIEGYVGVYEELNDNNRGSK